MGLRMDALRMDALGLHMDALHMDALGLRMDDKVMCVAMVLRLGASLYHPHECHLCGAGVDHQGSHNLHCQRSLGHHPRHMVINDLIKRSLATAKTATPHPQADAAESQRLHPLKPTGTSGPLDPMWQLQVGLHWLNRQNTRP